MSGKRQEEKVDKTYRQPRRGVWVIEFDSVQTLLVCLFVCKLVRLCKSD